MITINKNRLLKQIKELGSIGENAQGGVDRALGSESDLLAREWLKSYWKQAFQQETHVDAIANLWLNLKGSKKLKRIVIGSHHDAVPNGGKYDGALGVLMATEVLLTLKEQNIRLEHPVSIVSFTGEEPNPYGVSTLGSKVLAGRLSKENLSPYRHRETKETLISAIERLGGNLHQWGELVKKEELGAFLECHIEQGERLEQRHEPVGVVSAITGIYREEITILGEANHAGTTRMDRRKDAFLGACEVALALERYLKSCQDKDIVGTTGYVHNEPNEANIISGVTRLLLDVRISDKKQLSLLQEEITNVCADIEKARGVKIERKVILNQPAQPMSDPIMDAIKRGILSVGAYPIPLISMAGHDAANLATMTQGGMLFVKSIAGKSHCKEEYSTPEDIEVGANALLQTLFILDKEMKE